MFVIMVCGGNMAKTIEAIYENGVLKPLSGLNLKEHERVKIILEKVESVARATSGMIKGLDDKIIDEIALSPEFLPEEV
jgi:predicted DNA-binding antitoxin AbrB/MazE fold protein